MGIVSIKYGAKYCLSLDIEDESVKATKQNSIDSNVVGIESEKQDLTQSLNINFIPELIIGNLNSYLFKEGIRNIVNTMSQNTLMIASGILIENYKEINKLFIENHLKEIDKYCALHHIKLIPSQNTLGHMHRWLKHEKYKHLAECPNGNPHPFSLDIEPYSLNVTDERSFELSIALIKEMREHVRTKNAFNVNLDEVFDLGLGRSNEIWKKEGTIDLFLGRSLKNRKFSSS